MKYSQFVKKIICRFWLIWVKNSLVQKRMIFLLAFKFACQYTLHIIYITYSITTTLPLIVKSKISS